MGGSTHSFADVLAWLNERELVITRTIGETPTKLYAIDIHTRQVRFLLKLRRGDELPAVWVPSR